MKKQSPSSVYWLSTRTRARRYNLYLNITNRCSNNCYFCFRRFRQGLGTFNLTLRDEPSPRDVVAEIQRVRHRHTWNEFVFCGFGEPFERLDCILEVTKWIRAHALRNVVRIDTNGQGSLLNPGRQVARELKREGVDKVSVSLNGHDSATYNEICRPTFANAFAEILEFIAEAKAEGLVTEITALTLPEVNFAKIQKIAQNMQVEFRLREYVPGFW